MIIILYHIISFYEKWVFWVANFRFHARNCLYLNAIAIYLMPINGVHYIHLFLRTLYLLICAKCWVIFIMRKGFHKNAKIHPVIPIKPELNSFGKTSPQAICQEWNIRWTKHESKSSASLNRRSFVGVDPIIHTAFIRYHLQLQLFPPNQHISTSIHFETSL